jgi:hypothetical protein
VLVAHYVWVDVFDCACKCLVSESAVQWSEAWRVCAFDVVYCLCERRATPWALK